MGYSSEKKEKKKKEKEKKKKNFCSWTVTSVKNFMDICHKVYVPHLL